MAFLAGYILGTTVWFEVLAVFHFAIFFFFYCNFENRKMLRIHVTNEPLTDSSLLDSSFDKAQVFLFATNMRPVVTDHYVCFVCLFV